MDGQRASGRHTGELEGGREQTGGNRERERERQGDKGRQVKKRRDRHTEPD